MGQLYSFLKKALLKVHQRKARHRCRLPLEMECEIFKFLKVPIQTKFIWGMGRGIYEMFGQALLVKSKRLRNPRGIRLHSNTWIWNPISANGLKVLKSRDWVLALADQGFDICVHRCRMDHFPGTILYYFEVTQTSSDYFWGLSVGLSSEHSMPESYPYGSDSCFITGNLYDFQWPADGAFKIKPKWNSKGDVYGCGIFLNSKNELAIFFTANGILMGKQIPISPSANFLIPTVHIKKISVEANFGDNSKKPFKFDIKKCPGLVFQN